MIAREVSPYPADMSQWYDEDGHAGRVSERARQVDIILVQRAEWVGRVDLEDFVLAAGRLTWRE